MALTDLLAFKLLDKLLLPVLCNLVLVEDPVLQFEVIRVLLLLDEVAPLRLQLCVYDLFYIGPLVAVEFEFWRASQVCRRLRDRLRLRQRDIPHIFEHCWPFKPDLLHLSVRILPREALCSLTCANA